MVLTLRASIGGKTEEKRATVRVRRKVVKAERVYSTPYGKKEKTSNPLDFSKVKDWWRRTSDKYKAAWSYMPENKKLATKILGLMCAVMLVTSFAPKLFPIGLLAVMGYLTWIILKR
jgi:hypothetical protein